MIERVEIDIFIDKNLRELIPNKQNKTKIRIDLNPLPTLKLLKRRVNEAFPVFKNIKYNMQFIIPKKVCLILYFIFYFLFH